MSLFNSGAKRTADLIPGDIIVSIYPDSISADRITWAEPHDAYPGAAVRAFRAVRTIAWADGTVRVCQAAQSLYAGRDSVQPDVWAVR